MVMRVIGMDTSYKYLNICLLDGDIVVDSLHMECFKQQSEWMIPKLKELMDRHGWVSEDIEAMVITEGPGSYTGIRIAMTVAKVFCSSMNIPLYTLSTLQLYASNREHTAVLMDARGKRAYIGKYHLGKAVMEDTVLPIDELSNVLTEDDFIVGDGSLVGKEDAFEDVAGHFLALRPEWKKVENVNLLVPKYLKDTKEYLVK